MTASTVPGAGGILHGVFLVALVLSAFACATPPADEGSPNILLISLDALRADHLSCYGYDRLTSPVLDKLAAGGTRFSYAFANTHGTPPSHTTLLSSLYQESHGVDLHPEGREEGLHHIPARVELVQEILERHGWRTVGVTGGGYMSSEFGFSRGFEEFSDRARGIDEGARLLAQMLRDKSRDGKPVFAFLHTYEVHSPYAPPREYARLFGNYEGAVEASNEALVPIQNRAAQVLTREDFEYLESLYDGEIRYADHVLGRLFAELRESGFLDRALVIVTSDHGEEFGEHGGLLHRGTLYEELVHVPLILFGEKVPEGVVDPNLVSLVDVAPTVLAAARLPVPVVMEGRNVLGVPPSVPWPRQRVFSQYGSQLYSVRTPRWKLVFRPAVGRAQLFDLLRDPLEGRNLAKPRAEVADDLLAELEAWRLGRPPPILDSDLEKKLSREKKEELRALGYAE